MNQAVLNISRNDKFLLILDLPKILKSHINTFYGKSYNADTIQFTCYGSPVPSVKVPSIDIPYGGQVLKTTSSSRPSYGDLSISFLVDNGWKNYWILWQWINLFNDQRSGETVLNYKFSDQERLHTNRTSMLDLVSEFTTIALDEYNNKIISFRFNHAFPTSLSEINFSHQEASQISCKVNFSFNQIHAEPLVPNINS